MRDNILFIIFEVKYSDGKKKALKVVQTILFLYDTFLLQLWCGLELEWLLKHNYIIFIRKKKIDRMA